MTTSAVVQDQKRAVLLLGTDGLEWLDVMRKRWNIHFAHSCTLQDVVEHAIQLEIDRLRLDMGLTLEQSFRVGVEMPEGEEA
jgi:hypothetical protein